MGAWGYASKDSDNALDLMASLFGKLIAGDNMPTQKQVDEKLIKWAKKSSSTYQFIKNQKPVCSDDLAAYVGMVVWLIECKYTVPNEMVKTAWRTAERLTTCGDYVLRFDQPKKVISALKKEMRLLFIYVDWALYENF